VRASLSLHSTVVNVHSWIGFSEQVAAVSFEIDAPRQGGSRIAATKGSSHNG